MEGIDFSTLFKQLGTFGGTVAVLGVLAWKMFKYYADTFLVPRRDREFKLFDRLESNLTTQTDNGVKFAVALAQMVDRWTEVRDKLVIRTNGPVTLVREQPKGSGDATSPGG